MHTHKQIFKTYKERGEWVELRFMTEAVEHGFKISRPWGECNAYDVGVENGANFLRVQVKSTTVRTGTGYFCQFKPNYHKKQDYTIAQIDFFAAYIIPVDVWYIIPSRLLLGPKRKQALMLFPVDLLKKNRYSFEPTKKPGHCWAKADEPWPPAASKTGKGMASAVSHGHSLPQPCPSLVIPRSEATRNLLSPTVPRNPTNGPKPTRPTPQPRSGEIMQPRT